jgi:glycosyltransferase involved in cell wall biosynthesis
MNDQHCSISVVFPVFNEEASLVPLYEQVRDALQKAEVTSYEMVFVDNGSYDRSLEIMKTLRQNDPRVRYVSLSRNFGHQGGLLAGVRHSRGDAVITMDADLQHPPSLIPEMIRLWRRGCEVVFTVKHDTGMSAWRRLQMRVFYGIISKFSGLQLSFGQSDFRLLDRKVVETILSIPEYRMFIRGIVNWVGFRQAGVSYVVAPRFAGKSKFSLRTLIGFALDGILAFSTVPLRWVFLVGALTAGACFLYMGLAVVLGVLRFTGSVVVVPPGWATLAVAIMFLGSIQLIAIGILGEYLGRVFDQTKGRPMFIVRELSDAD